MTAPTRTSKSLYEEATEYFARWRRSRLRRKLRAKSAKYKAVWANKSNDSIIAAHKDAIGWVLLESPGKHTRGYKSVSPIAQRSRKRLKTYILPEMKKRGIHERKYTLYDYIV